MIALLPFFFAAVLPSTVHFTLTAARGWPADVTVNVIDLQRGGETQRVVHAPDAVRPVALTLAPGRYRIAITAPHQRQTWREVVVGPDVDLNLGELALTPRPVVRGRVADENGAPVAAATIRAGTSEARSSGDGAFALELPEEGANFATIDAPKRGTRVVELRHADLDVELPAVTMSPAARLHVDVEGFAGELDAELQLRTERRFIPLRRRHARASFDFDGLGAGSYVLVLRGAAPLERLGTPIIVGDGDTRRVTVAIHPLPFQGVFTLVGKPVANATVALESADFGWRTELRTDGEGRAHGFVWQRGELTATVAGNRHHKVVLQGRDEISLRLDLADRVIRGRVSDRDGLPVPGAGVLLRTTSANGGTSQQTDTGADGTYAFNGVDPGEQRVALAPLGYLIPEPVKFKMNAADTLRDASFVLDTGALHVLRVRDAAGHPAAGAQVIAVVYGAMRARAMADNEGRAELPLPKEPAVVHVLGRDGAFTSLRVAEDVTPVALPPPASSLSIATRTSDGKPLPNVSFLPAFEGVLMPPAVVRWLESIHGTPLRTGADGEVTLSNIPAGPYQFWPYRTDEEAEAIVAAGAFNAPITVNVKSGANAIVVDFTPRPN